MRAVIGPCRFRYMVYSLGRILEEFEMKYAAAVSLCM